jgi:hypothetical protein
MAETIAKLIIKRSSVSGALPPSEFLGFGELALNYADRLLFFKDSSGNIATIYGGDVAKKALPNTFTATNTFNNKTIFNAGIDLKHIVLSVYGNTAYAYIPYDGRLANYATVTLNKHATLINITDANVGTYTICVKQDSAGFHVLSFDTNYFFAAGSRPVISLIPNTTTLITVVKLADSDNLYIINCQPNMTSLVNESILNQPPGVIHISGILQNATKDLSLIGDINGLPAWQYIEQTPSLTGYIRWLLYAGAPGASTYLLETFASPLPDANPINWTLLPGIRYAGTGYPFLIATDHTGTLPDVVWPSETWTNIGTLPGDPEDPDDMTITIDTYVEPLYSLTVASLGTSTAYDDNSGARVGDVSQLFGYSDQITWSDFGADSPPYFLNAACAGPYPFSKANKDIHQLFIALKTEGTYAGKYVICANIGIASNFPVLEMIAYKNVINGVKSGTYVGIVDSQLTFTVAEI